MTDEMIDILAEKTADELRTAICEMRDDVKAAELAIYEETQDNDDAKPKPKLSLSFAIGVNLLNRNVETKLSLSVKHTCKGSVQLPDPQQPEFSMPQTGKRNGHNGSNTDTLTLEADTSAPDNDRALAVVG